MSQRLITIQKQPPRGVPRKRCSKNMQQIYRRTPTPKCDFNKVACNFIEITLRRGCSPVNLLHIFTKPFSSNTSGWLLLTIWLMVLKILLLIVYCEIIANPLTFSISSFSTVLKFSSIFVSHTGQNLSPNWYLMSILKY